MSGLLSGFPMIADAVEKLKNTDWGEFRAYARENPADGLVVGALCFIASMGMDVLINILRWGGLAAVALFGYMAFQKKKLE